MSGGADPFAVFPHGELEAAAELGAVSDDAVRVWLRRPGAASVEATLSVEGHPSVTGSATLSAASDWTGAVELRLPAPAPGRAFTCTVQGRQLRGRLAPPPGAPDRLRFAFGSCHLPFRATAGGGIGFDDGVGIYPAMIKRLERERADLLLLVGDQVYSDAPELLSVQRAFPPEGGAPPFEALLAFYRRQYRGFFNVPGFRELRERFPTYTIWDDHDIIDAWGSHEHESAYRRRLFEAATRACAEYQQQRNPGGALAPPPFHYSFLRGDVGFFVLDLRGERSYEHGRLLGEGQWRALDDFLGRCDAISVPTVFIVASVPVAHVSRWTVRWLGWVHEEVGENLRDRWCCEAFLPDRDRFLDTLLDWQAAGRQRQVVLLSGDVHAASAFTIRRRRGAGVIRQFNSSAFSHPLHGVDLFLNRVGVYAPNLFEPHYRFRRQALVYHNNFGLVRVDPLAAGGHRIEFTVHAWLPGRKQLQVRARVESVPSRT